MPNHLNLEPALRFLDDLNKNNNKFWFDQHRPDYESAGLRFEEFVGELIEQLRASDRLQGLSAKECIFRIYRDIRFSKDKTPYKTNLAATIAPGGRKAIRLGYYVSIEPHDQSMVAGGMHMPTSGQLNKFRKAIDSKATEFKKIISAKEFVEAFGPIEGERLKTVPQGYNLSHPEIGLLRLKQITVIHRFSDEEVIAPDFLEQVIRICRAMKPFLDYLNDVTQANDPE